MNQTEERTGLISLFGAIAGIFLGIFLLFFSFSMHYVNEMSTNPVNAQTLEGRQTLFDKIVFGDASRAAAKYKKEFMHTVTHGHIITNWIFRLLAVFLMWLGLTLIFGPIFTRYARDTLGMYALYIAIALSLVFISGLYVYSFIVGGGLNFIGSFFDSVKSMFAGIGNMIGGFFSGLLNIFSFGKSSAGDSPNVPFGGYIFFFFLFAFLSLFFYHLWEKNKNHEKRVGAFKVYDPDGENEK